MIRPARRDDVPAISAFTQETFTWGDYVPRQMESWLDEEAYGLFVFADDHDRPVALARVHMLSPAEAWFGALRVHPDHRGKRIAGLLTVALIEWARSRGGQVARLLIEDWNEPAVRTVERAGMRPVCSVSYCERTIGDASPVPGGNGGRRVPATLRARQARAAEAEPAFASWSVGEIGIAAHGLFSVGWTFRRLTMTDLAEAARAESLWEIGAGWGIASLAEATLQVGWIEAREENADSLIRALVDLATSRGAERLELWVPSLPWLTRAARKAGCGNEAMSVWELPLT